MCRYGTRSPVANARLSLDPTGRVVLSLKRPLRDGRTELTFTPIDFLRRLATLIPPPRRHLTRYHGVFARARVPATNIMVVSTADGALWRVDSDGHIVSLKAGGVPVTRMLAIPDGTSIGIGYGNGTAIIIDTRSGQQTALPRASDAVQDIAITPDSGAQSCLEQKPLDEPRVLGRMHDE